MSKTRRHTDYALIDIPNVGRYWWRDCNDVWMNEAGKRLQKSSKIVVVERSRHSEYDDLDHSKTSLLDPHSKMGWLSPQGKFYGCAPRLHDTLARLVIHQKVALMEAAGWFRIQQKLIGKRFPTAAQRNWASLNGREFEDSEFND